ncbi:MAG: hypothetical protein ACAH80_01400 [Alphaproteobacteria bacterium]
MTVIFWKINCAAFNALAARTSLDVAVERYAASGSVEDLLVVQKLVAARPEKAPFLKTPFDVVIERVAQGGCDRDVQMLRALMKSRNKSLKRLPFPKAA